MTRIYLDHAATTPVHPEVAHVMTEHLSNQYGNPSSIHHYGRESKKLLDEARNLMASSINADFSSIIFTSGGTEANNLAIFGSVYARSNKGKHIITSSIEHHAVLHPFEQLEAEGFEVTYLSVDPSGVISVEDVQAALREDTIFVSVMTVNNETGHRQPLEEIGELLADHQAVFHTDAVQAFGVEKIDVDALRVDLLSVSSHKIYGPKGIGFLYKRNEVDLKRRVFGGEQERKWRSGTENTLAIEGFKQAVNVLKRDMGQRTEHYQKLTDTLLKELDERFIVYEVNGEDSKKVPNIMNISFPGMDVEIFLMNLDLEGIAVSSGSACTAGSIDPSHVLKAMYGEEDPKLRNSIRFSFGIDNTEEEMVVAAEKIKKIIERLQG
ncbi:cysteine desulfurase NifS [Halalkalibacillus sediminis]|uniref:cysteine desulfurase n=1 Tax=Halalkalibacillus sediminis TaxID=2018042 RepID=A0A2I0QXM9_9BACI|nr:cysteine desulfurase family protein [Halalkalibacillus sediminis]PKR79084.1 cysteine desulfurase NifS [Halalkalibacillus sediminis]